MPKHKLKEELNCYQMQLASTQVCFQVCQALRVEASWRRKEALQTISGEGIEAVTLDVTSEESVTAAVKEIIAAAGRIDVLICNAGVVL